MTPIPEDPHAISPTPDAADMLALLEREQLSLTRRKAAGVPWILLAWGLGFVIGFGALWASASGAIDGLAAPVAGVVCAAAMVAALVVSAVVGARMGRGIRSDGDADHVGVVFGLTWPAGLGALALLGAALAAHGMDAAAQAIYYPTAGVLFVGIMYVLAGGIWKAWQTTAMGGWFVIVAVAAAFFGAPTHLLVLAVAGGGMFLLAALYTGVWVLRGGERSTTAATR